jgi:DNA-binding HxlR family transcriptional regulator
VPMPQDSTGYDPMYADCPSRQVLDLIADKWTVLVVSAINHGHHRNGQLLRQIGGISQKALTRTLRQLEHDGLIVRHDHGGLPRHVEYQLTETGASLQPLLAALCEWSITHMLDVTTARSRSDQQVAT